MKRCYKTIGVLWEMNVFNLLNFCYKHELMLVAGLLAQSTPVITWYSSTGCIPNIFLVEVRMKPHVVLITPVW